MSRERRCDPVMGYCPCLRACTRWDEALLHSHAGSGSSLASFAGRWEGMDFGEVDTRGLDALKAPRGLAKARGLVR